MFKEVVTCLRSDSLDFVKLKSVIYILFIKIFKSYIKMMLHSMDNTNENWVTENLVLYVL
jgi:hypothetical protein